MQECDIVIISLLGERKEETEYIIELLMERVKNNNENKENGLNVLAIGSHMTWAYWKRKTEANPSTDKERLLKKILGIKNSQAEMESQNEIDSSDKERSVDDEKMRYPHHLWSWNYDQEQKIANLNKNKNVKAIIITTGLLYGKDFPCPEFSTLLSQAHNREEIVCYGDGSNILATTNIDDLLNQVEKALKLATCNNSAMRTTMISLKTNSTFLRTNSISLKSKHSSFKIKG